MSPIFLAAKNAFPFDRAFTHGAVTITGLDPLTFETPPPCWAYAVTIPAAWPPGARWIRERDGSVRVRLRVRGRVLLEAIDASGHGVIDQAIVESTSAAIEVDLVSVPLGACDALVVRNASPDGVESHVAIDGIECVDLGPAQSSEGDLAPPADAALKPVDDWWRYYGVAQSLPDRVRSARYARLDRTRTMPWHENLTVHIYPHDDLSRALYISGTYEPSTLVVLQRALRSGATFIDVGANAGLFSMLASRWVGAEGRVYAFEPSEREYRRLLDHLALNRLTNVTAVRQAVADHQGPVQLRVATFPNAGHNTLGESFAYPTVQVERIEPVEAITLDRFAQIHSLPRVDAIKMDIEGGERAALAGSRAILDRFRPVLLVEASTEAQAGFGAGATGVIELLQSAGYAPYRIGHGAELRLIGPGEDVPDANVVALPLERAAI